MGELQSSSSPPIRLGHHNADVTARVVAFRMVQLTKEKCMLPDFQGAKLPDEHENCMTFKPMRKAPITGGTRLVA